MPINILQQAENDSFYKTPRKKTPKRDIKSEMCKIDVKGKAAICSNEVGKDDEQNFEIKESRAPVQNAILEISEKFFASRVERRRCHLVVIGVPAHQQC